MSSANNKGTQYDPPGYSVAADSPKPGSGNPKKSPARNVMNGNAREEASNTGDLADVSSDEEPPILPPRVSITPRSGLKSRSASKRHESRGRHSATIDEEPRNGKRTSGSTGTLSDDTEKRSKNISKLSARLADKPSTKSGKLSRVIGEHTRDDQDAAVAWTAEYRSKLSEEDRLMRLQITAHNSHPECLKPATAAGLTRRLTLGNYLPNLSSVQFVVKNEVNFWPSSKRMTKGIGHNIERVAYSRHAMRGTGVHSARLRTDEERRASNLSPRVPPARKSNIVTNRVSLLSRSADRTQQPVSNSFRPVSEPARLHRHGTSSVPATKQARLQRYCVSGENLSKPIDRVATANRRHRSPPASDASDPTPSEFEEATGKVRAWITHRERLSQSQANPEATSNTPRGLWNTGLSPLQRDMMLPLRKAHPLARSTLTVGNFLTDGTASKRVAGRVAALRVEGGRRQIGVPS